MCATAASATFSWGKRTPTVYDYTGTDYVENAVAAWGVGYTVVNKPVIDCGKLKHKKGDIVFCIDASIHDTNRTSTMTNRKTKKIVWSMTHIMDRIDGCPQSLYTHEFGHDLGLPHNFEPDSVMNPYTCNDTPSPNDLGRVRK